MTAEVAPTPPSRAAGFAASVIACADEVVVHLFGEADLASAAVLEEALVSPLATDPAYRRLVLDFEDLRFIDACCIGIIADARTGLVATGRDLVVRSPAPLARRVLGICGLDGMFEATTSI